MSGKDSEKGMVFTLKRFGQYFTENYLHHVVITTDVPQGNNQVENLNADNMWRPNLVFNI